MRLVLLATPLMVTVFAYAQQAKEFDVDVNYDEAKVPAFHLPPLLETDEGEQVTTPEQWFNVRRPQILSSFSNLIYGRIPVPPTPLKTRVDVLEEDPAFMGGRATMKQVRIEYRNGGGRVEQVLRVYSPNDAGGPAPALILHSFDNTRSSGFREHHEDPQRLRNGWPIGELIDRGFGFIAVYQGDLVAHNEVEFNKGIAPLFYREGQSFPKANEWGVLAQVAWGAMRALDYLETDDSIDASRVAVMGHSKMGKAALWTAAQDQRFAAAVSAQSGCAGAALWRRCSGETLEEMVTRFPYWLCANAWKFTGRENDLPVDQHMLLALIAPRPVYVMSGEDDGWADPRGEYLSAYHATPVYALLGETGLDSEASPPVGEPIQDRTIGYHIRAGGHSVDDYDWAQVMTFLQRHLQRTK